MRRKRLQDVAHGSEAQAAHQSGNETFAAAMRHGPSGRIVSPGALWIDRSVFYDIVRRNPDKIGTGRWPRSVFGISQHVPWLLPGIHTVIASNQCGNAVGRDPHRRPGRLARIPAVHACRAAAGLALALGVLFVAPLLPGANGTAYAQATAVSLSVSPDEVGESAGATTLTVVGTLNGGAFTQNTAVALTVSAGTAAETDDYAAGTATLTILAGQTAGTATLTLTPVDDDIDEEDETVIVKGTVTGLEVTPDTVTITDNDSAGVTVSHSALGVYPFARAHYTVVLDSQPSGTVTVSVEGGSSDIEVVSPSTLTFNERTWSTPQTVTVYARLNTDPEILDFVEPHTLTHTVTGYGSVTEAANVTVTVGWEYDDDRPGVSVSPWTIDIRAPEGGAADSYTVVLDTEPSGTVTVTVHGAGDDLTVSPSPLTFDGTNWATAQTVTVEAVDDAIAEGQERIRLTHTIAGYSDEFYGDVTRARSVTVKVVDNDTAGVTVSPTSISAAEGAAAGSYTVVLDSEPSGMVTVTVGGAGDDVTVSPSTLTFDGTTWATAQTVTVEAVDDALTEGEEEVTLTHTARDGGYDGVRIAGLAVTVDDNDAAGVTVGPTSISATEGAAAGSYQVVLDSQPSGTVTVTVGAAGSDVSVSPSPLTFDGTTWATAQTVTVTAVDDALAEGQEEVTLTHTVAGYGDVTEAADVTVTVVDDDAAGVTVGPTSISATEGGGAGSYTVVLNTAPSGTVTVTVGGAGDDLTVSPSPLTFDGTTWATAQTVTVTAVDDALAEGQEEVALTHTVVGYGVVTEAGDVTVAVFDNDTAGVTVSHSVLTVTVFGRAHYTVVLDSQPSGTVTVTVGGGSADVEVSPSTLTFNESTWGMAQTVSVFAALGTDQDLEYVLPHTLTHTVTDYGSVTEGPDVTVTVVDDETLRVAVNPTSISAHEGGATETYAMVLQSEPSAPVTVDITTDGDVSVSPRQLRFTAADWFTPRTVTVRAGHDGDDENDEVTLTHAMTSTDRKFDGKDASPVVVTVRDDEINPVEGPVPSFGGATVQALTLVLGRAIRPVVLPPATGGNGTLGYSLTSDPAGLAGLVFDAAARGLSGTPGTVGSYVFTFRADDADSDTAELTFAVTVTVTDLGRVVDAVQRTLAAVGTQTLSSALGHIGARFADIVPSASMTLADQQLRPGVVGGGPHGAAGACPFGGFEHGGLERFGAGPEDCSLGGARSRSVEAEELLRTSAFSLTLGAAEGSPEADPLAPGWSVWGRGDFSTFEGRPEGMRYDGEARSGWLGIDARAGRWVAGLALSHGVAEAEYGYDGGAAPDGRGRLETTLTALYPYGRWTVADGLELRGVLGAGRGEARHDPEDGERETSDLKMRMVSFGVRQELPEVAGIDLAARADASLVRMEIGDGPETIGGVSADSWRGRLGLEASRRFALDDESALTPFVEVAGRRDGGDGLVGSGLEVAGGVRYSAPRLQVEARGRVLAAHAKEGARERGVSVTARVGPGAHGRGLSLELSPRWGAVTGGAKALWRDEMPRLSGVGDAAAFDARIGYGVALSPEGGLLTPFAEAGLSDGESRRVRLGTRFDASLADLSLELAGERSENGDAPPDHGIRLELKLRF